MAGTDHELVDGSLKVARDDDGKPLGIDAVCTCGWKCRRFTSLTASVAFRDHQDSKAAAGR